MDYKIGSGDPTLWRDAGAGIWGSEPTTLTARAEKIMMYHQLPSAAALIGMNAARHMKHYLDNSGADLWIDLAGMLKSVSSARDVFNSELKEAREFAETLPPGEHKITSSKINSGYNIPQESKDWYYAVGGYECWGKAKVSVPDSNTTKYSMEFEYCFFDQYNWNKGIGVDIAGFRITDDFMGKFHRQGIAKEFELRGTHRVNVEWQPGGSLTFLPSAADMTLPLAVGRGLWHSVTL